MKSALFLALLLLFSFSPLSLSETPAPPEQYDYLIKNAVIFDGESYRPVTGDAAILGDRIAAVGDLSGAAARNVIEAKGLTLAPGFIDAHTHSDFNPLVYAGLPNKILQGVTTEITGNCGMSAAPVQGRLEDKVREIWAREGVEIDKPDWQSFEEYKKTVLQKGLTGNLSSLTGHGNLRAVVMGYEPRKAAQGEILEMRKMLQAAMREGSAGISFGLIYLPGIYADAEEITQLCAEAAAANGICAFHMRSEGAMLLEAIREVIAVARATKARIQISHLKAGGRKNWDKIGQALALIEEARKEGLDVAADAYPYTATAAELGVILPDAIFQSEDREDLFKNPLRRGELLEKLRAHYQERSMKWDTVMIASAARKEYRDWEGKSILQIAVEKKLEPEKLLVELLADNNFEVSGFNFGQSEDVVFKVESKPYVSVGSDSVADGSRKPHPRAWGSFPRMFRVFVRDRKILGLGELIRKITSMPADHFRLENRGRIKAGAFADLVLFDAGEIADTADYQYSKEPSRGVRWVFVNGRPVLKNGEMTAERPGRVLGPGR